MNVINSTARLIHAGARARTSVYKQLNQRGTLLPELSVKPQSHKLQNTSVLKRTADQHLLAALLSVSWPVVAYMQYKKEMNTARHLTACDKGQKEGRD